MTTSGPPPLYSSVGTASGVSYANGIVQPSAGGSGVRQAFLNRAVSPSIYGWVLNNGEVWQNYDSPAQVGFPEPVVGCFSNIFQDLYGMGASGQFYAFASPTQAVGALGHPASFCGFVAEQVTSSGVSYGAYYATGKDTASYRYSVVHGVWQRVSVALTKPGNPNFPQALDTGSAVFSAVPVPLPLTSDPIGGPVLIWYGAPV